MSHPLERLAEPDMRLHHYRNHLARELDQRPDHRSQDIQSYVLTTAILARRIDDRLRGRLKSESITARCGSPLDFRQLLGLLIHYSRFEPGLDVIAPGRSEDPPDEPFFRINSKGSRTQRAAAKLLAIRLADYFRVIEKMAHDDVFVLRHLVPATINRLKHASAAGATADPDALLEVVASLDDAIHLIRDLAGTLLSLRDVPLHAFDIRFERRGSCEWDLDTQLDASDLYPTFGSLIDGYETEWRYTPFAPSTIGGPDHCIPIEIPDPNFRPMALPFSGLADTFDEIQKRLPNP